MTVSIQRASTAFLWLQEESCNYYYWEELDFCMVVLFPFSFPLLSWLVCIGRCFAESGKGLKG